MKKIILGLFLSANVSWGVPQDSVWSVPHGGSLATWQTPLPLTAGGTGLSSCTQYGLVVGEGTSSFSCGTGIQTNSSNWLGVGAVPTEVMELESGSSFDTRLLIDNTSTGKTEQVVLSNSGGTQFAYLGMDVSTGSLGYGDYAMFLSTGALQDIVFAPNLVIQGRFPSGGGFLVGASLFNSNVTNVLDVSTNTLRMGSTSNAKLADQTALELDVQSSGISAPIVTNPVSGYPDMVAEANISVNGSTNICSVANTGGGIASCTYNSTGNYNINFTSGLFADAVRCDVTPQNQANLAEVISVVHNLSSATTIDFQLQHWTGSAFVVFNPDGFDIICFGKRGL